MPFEDYCPNCNTLLAIPDGVPEVVCPQCHILLEFDPTGPQDYPTPLQDPNTIPTEPYQDYDADDLSAPPHTSTETTSSRIPRGTKSRRIKLNTSTPARKKKKKKTKGSKTDSRPLPPVTPKTLAPEPTLNFVSDEDQYKTDSGSIPRDLSNIKIAAPVNVDNVTGLIAPAVTDQPVEPVPEPPSEAKTQVVIPGMKIVGSSKEFRLDKDMPPPAAPPPPAPPPQRPSVQEEELRRAAEKAREEADKARFELEQMKRLAEEERRRLESEKVALQAQHQADEAHRSEEALRKIAEEAKQQAEAFRQQLAEQEEKQSRKDDALAKAKADAMAKAKERLIAEKTKKLIEEAKKRKASETGTMPPVSEAPRKKKKKLITKSSSARRPTPTGKSKIDLSALSKAARKRNSGNSK